MQTSLDAVARLSGVAKRYGSITALDGVDLVLQRGELLAVLGPNGAGKSTSISLLLGLIRPDGGRAELFGMDPQQIDARRRIGVMLQSAMLPPTLRVGELLRLVASYYPHPRPLKESAALAGIDDLLNRAYGKLSGGQQRRVQFALALCGRPELVFLDEPTVGMDIDARRKLWSAMRNLVAEGCSIVLTTHYLEEAEALAQRVVVMAKGRVLSEGSVDALRAQGYQVDNITVSMASNADQQSDSGRNSGSNQPQQQSLLNQGQGGDARSRGQNYSGQQANGNDGNRSSGERGVEDGAAGGVQRSRSGAVYL